MWTPNGVGTQIIIASTFEILAKSTVASKPLLFALEIALLSMCLIYDSPLFIKSTFLLSKSKPIILKFSSQKRIAKGRPT